MPAKPRYREVADDLIGRIGPGRDFPPGSQLPTRAELCEQYGVSEFVADRAFWILRELGMTDTVHGVGVYVREATPD